MRQEIAQAPGWVMFISDTTSPIAVNESTTVSAEIEPDGNVHVEHIFPAYNIPTTVINALVEATNRWREWYANEREQEQKIIDDCENCD